MNSNNTELSRISLLLSLAVVFTIAAYYIPWIGILSFMSGSVFMIIAIISSRKSYMLLSLIAYFFLIFLVLEPLSAIVNTSVFSIPCLVMGYMMKKPDNEDISYLVSTLIMSVSVILLFTVFMRVIGFDFFESLRESFNLYMSHMREIVPDYSVPENMNVELMVSTSRMLFPSLVLIFSLLVTLISKYMGILIFNRIFPKNSYKFKPFREFVIPDKMGLFFIVFYAGVYLLSYLNILSSSYSDRFISNVLTIMIYMLIIQGLAVISFFISRFPKALKIIAVIAIILMFRSLYMMIAFAAILDMTFDFRKIRNRRIK